MTQHELHQGLTHKLDGPFYEDGRWTASITLRGIESKTFYGLKPSKELETFLNETHPPTGEALDLGCGEGRNSLLLARYGYHVYALDASSQGIEKLEKYAHSQGLDNIDGEVADVRTVQLKPNQYDAIIAVTILDHISEEEGKKVAESLIPFSG